VLGHYAWGHRTPKELRAAHFLLILPSLAVPIRARLAQNKQFLQKTTRPRLGGFREPEGGIMFHFYELPLIAGRSIVG
jgi:hypothetical protein